MNMKNYALDIAVKMFTSPSPLDLEKQINIWMNDNRDVLVTGLDVTSAYDSANSRIEYTAILAYQNSERESVLIGKEKPLISTIDPLSNWGTSSYKH